MKYYEISLSEIFEISPSEIFQIFIISLFQIFEIFEISLSEIFEITLSEIFEISLSEIFEIFLSEIFEISLSPLFLYFRSHLTAAAHFHFQMGVSVCEGQKGWFPSAKLKPTFTFLVRDFAIFNTFTWQNPFQEK